MSKQSDARLVLAIATVFGVGRSRFAPGTAGSVVALPFAWLIAEFCGRGWLLLAATIILLPIGTWACEMYASAKGEVDPKECVIDEVAGQWIVCAFAPILTAWYIAVAWYFFAFVLFRVFDIWKPWPISWVERKVPGGLGIMADDVVAALMGSIIIAVIAHVVIS
jgi:phosphatidylglycerophosphatase A